VNWVTLVVWLITAVGGFALVGIWLRNGAATAATRRFPMPAPFVHALFAVASLVLFLVYWATDSDSLKVVVLIGLLVTAVLGIWMFLKWVGGLSARTAATGGPAGTAPEDSFPVALVALHGIAAVSTLVLFIIAAFVVAD